MSMCTGYVCTCTNTKALGYGLMHYRLSLHVQALEAALGRMLELRHWMVKLNRGLDFVSLDDILVDLKLTPDVRGEESLSCL
jgi:hypothetical protein